MVGPLSEENKSPRRLGVWDILRICYDLRYCFGSSDCVPRCQVPCAWRLKVLERVWQSFPLSSEFTKVFGKVDCKTWGSGENGAKLPTVIDCQTELNSVRLLESVSTSDHGRELRNMWKLPWMVIGCWTSWCQLSGSRAWLLLRVACPVVRAICSAIQVIEGFWPCFLWFWSLFVLKFWENLLDYGLDLPWALTHALTLGVNRIFTCIWPIVPLPCLPLPSSFFRRIFLVPTDIN